MAVNRWMGENILGVDVGGWECMDGVRERDLEKWVRE